jgi:hypothetical protein
MNTACDELSVKMRHPRALAETLMSRAEHDNSPDLERKAAAGK